MMRAEFGRYQWTYEEHNGNGRGLSLRRRCTRAARDQNLSAALQNFAHSLISVTFDPRDIEDNVLIFD
jgi:hypothetical protein